MDYELLDFGQGRRLERFGTVLIDRPCPAAQHCSKSDETLWNENVVRFEFNGTKRSESRGSWVPDLSSSWQVTMPPLILELQGTPFGHLGIFPEQYSNWVNIRNLLETSKNRPLLDGKIRILNLFAYTGGSSLAAAMAGPELEVVHVDAASSAVQWAKRNAQLNHIGQDQTKGIIRFIVEDVRKFVKREIKRKHLYHGIILDPPGYGHGAKGESWKLLKDLPELLEGLAQVLAPDPIMMLLTAHDPELDPEKLSLLANAAGLTKNLASEKMEMTLRTRSGRILPAGYGLWCQNR